MKLFFNARFYTMKKERDFVNAVLVKNDRIVDTFQQIPENINAERIDLQNCYVFPGFVDTHTHSFEGGLYSLSADLGKVNSIVETLDNISSTKPISGMIFAYHFDETQINEKRFPTIGELDKIFPDVPIILRRVDGHSCVINSFAAKQIFMHNELPAHFDGLLRQRWNDRAANWFHQNLDEEGIFFAYQKASEIAVKNGHTTIHTMIGNGYSNPEHFEFIRNSLHKFDVEFILYPQITDVDVALKLNSPRVGGCILADGSFGSHTAALLEPYSDRSQCRGNLYHSDEFWENFITKAHQNDLQIAIHAIGDDAISQIIRFYRKVQKENPKDLRHQVIHNELTDDNMLDVFAKNNISAVMQPMFDQLWAVENGLYEKRLGKDRTLRTNRLNSILKRNILLTGSSDWYVTDLNALKGINAATKMHNPHENISIFQAVEIYTKNAAKLSFSENRLGIIDKGFQADFIILNDDIFTCKDITQLQILKVIKSGKIILS